MLPSAGVDPSVKVVYRPLKRFRETGGLISKVVTHTYQQVTEITNTREETATVTFTDQVPYSQEEKLKVRRGERWREGGRERGREGGSKQVVEGVEKGGRAEQNEAEKDKSLDRWVDGWVGDYRIALIFRGSLILQISRVWNRSGN